MGFLASPIIQQILAGIQAAINAAPQVEGIVTSGIALFKSLFEAGLISVETQNASWAYMQGISAMVKSGNIPPAWQVQPDPETITLSILPPSTTSAAAPTTPYPASK